MMNAENAPARAFWCRIPSRPNFGDALTPWLIQRVTGRYPRFAPPDAASHKYLVTGSVIALASAPCTVWGAGIMNADDRIDERVRLMAVRGPLTRERALACGAACPPVLGDPALLLPRFYRPDFASHPGPGLIAHFSDHPRLDIGMVEAAGVRVIDVQSSIEQVIQQICACEWVMSSSLHGLIASHAYGVPAVWIKYRDLPSGDDSKFRDHYLALGVEPPAAASLGNQRPDLRALERRAWCPDRVDTDALWQACPFRQPERCN